MDWKGRFAAFGVVAAALLAIEDMLVPAIALPLLVLAIALAWRFTEGFWRTVAYGLVGGAIAGLLIMGPGFRLAMRVVAIMDSARTPEFSIEGTFFFIIGIGGIFGALISAFGNLIRKSAQVTSVAVAGVVLGTVQMIMLLGDPWSSPGVLRTWRRAMAKHPDVRSDRTRLRRCRDAHRWPSGAQGQQQRSRGAGGRPGVKCHEHADV